MSYLPKYLASILVAVAIVATPASALDKVRVRVKPNAEVRDRVIRLNDIADIAGGDPEFVESLQDVVVGTSPPLGRDRLLSSVTVISRLRRRNIDPEGLEIEAPRYVRVYREAQEVSESKIRDLIGSYIEAHLPHQGGRVSLASFSLRGNRTIPRGTTTYEIIPPRGLSLVGNASFRVIARVDGEEATKLWAVIKVEIVAPAVVAVRSLPRGRILKPRDVVVAEASIGHLGKESFGEIEQVVGKRLSRGVNQGERILRHHIEAPTMIRRGSLVTVVVERGLLTVTARGIALEDGEKGKIIRVQNLSSKKTIYARVADSSTVRVDI